MWDYSEKVKEHFFHPRNAKLVEHANAKGDVGSISCGDALSLTLKVNPESEIIEDAGFQTFGCGSAIASSSALTEMIIGKTITQALTVTNQDIATYLDGLPPEKMHCSVMGMEALHAAVADYRGEAIEDTHEEGELICKCFAIDDLMIKRVVHANQLTTVEEVINYTKAGGACTSCHEKIEWVLDACLAEMAATDVLTEQAVLTGQTAEDSATKVEVLTGQTSEDLVPKVELLTGQTPEGLVLTGQTTEDLTSRVDETDQAENERIWAMIEQVITRMRPGVVADGGDIQLVDVDDNMVFIAMSGSCMGCGLSGLTLANLEQKISKALNRQYIVFPVQGEIDSHQQDKKEGTYNA